MNVVMLYFSGSGNTAYLIEQLEKQWQLLSVDYQTFEMEKFQEDDIEAINAADYVLFAYPVFGSMAPMIVWRFVKEYAAALKGKKGAVTVTQSHFSGDGGAYLARILKKCEMDVVSIEHFKMPDSRSDKRGFVLPSAAHLKKMQRGIDQKVELYAMDFSKEHFYKIGDHFSAMLLGSFQRIPFSKKERKLSKDVKFDWTRCTQCGLCVELCPTNNLSLASDDTKSVVQGSVKIEQAGNCTLCYRCVNKCPEKAISILSGHPPKVQYPGMKP